MNQLALGIAVIAVMVALTGRKGRLIALAVAWVAIFPVVRMAGARSAIFAPELVIAVALIPWLFRGKSDELPGAPGWLAPYICFVIVWVPAATFVGHLTLGTADIYYRVPMATLRVAAVLMSFAIPASTTLSKKEFLLALRALRVAFLAFLVLALVDYMHLLPIRFYFQVQQAAEDADDVKQTAYLSRGGLGSLAVVGVFVHLLSLRLRHGLRGLNLAAIMGFVVLVFLSESRSSMLALFAFGLTLATLHRGNRITNILIVLFGVITVYLVAVNIPFVAERLATLTNLERAAQSSGRIRGWMAVIHHFAANPLPLVIGLGYDCWGGRLTSVCGLYNGHNLYVHVLAELGLFGGIAYLAIFLKLGWHYFRAMRLPGDGQVIGGMALGLICGLAVSNMTIVGLYPIVVRLTAVHISLFVFGLAYGRIRRIMAEESLAAASPAVLHPQSDLPTDSVLQPAAPRQFSAWQTRP